MVSSGNNNSSRASPTMEARQILKTKMKRLNASGRTYVKDRPLSADFRKSIIDEVLRNGGDIYTSYFPALLLMTSKARQVATGNGASCP